LTGKENSMATDDPVLSHSEIHLFATGEPRRGLFRLFPPATRSELWGGLACVVLALLGAAGVLKCRADALALEQDSVNVEGKVVRLWTTKPKNRTYFHVEYEYPARAEADTPTFQDKAELDEQHFHCLEVGGPIAVTVCRTVPANHQVVGESPRVFSSTSATLFCLGLLALLAVMGAIMLWLWWLCRRQPQAAQVFVLFRFSSWT
jgi:hypothetical protein